MREISEQEQLASLIGSEDREPVDTAGLLEDALRSQLGGINPDILERTKQEIAASGDVIENKRITTFASNSSKKLPEGYSTEKILMAMYDVRDDLIVAFESIGINGKIAEKLTEAIGKVEVCIKMAGGEVEKFIPMDHVSGLAAPDLKENAQKVIETTLRCYSLGKVESAKIKNGGKTISITFSGNNNDISYVAEGEVSSEDWTGNEAIDYIYTPKGGSMTVKAYDNGRWIVKSTMSNKYKVLWNLEAIEAKEAKEDKKEIKEGSINISENNDNEEILVIKKEEKELIENNEEEIKDPL